MIWLEAACSKDTSGTVVKNYKMADFSNFAMTGASFQQPFTVNFDLGDGLVVTGEIFFLAQVKFHVQENYLSNQRDINGSMRAILVDWLIQVQQRFKLLQETLYVTVYILDRYLQVCVVRRHYCQEV